MTLQLFGLEPSNIFAIRGRNENSATIALGWTLDRCPAFRSALLAELLGSPPADDDDLLIDLQRSDDDGGFTDIEIVNQNVSHLIIEAKVGWSVPSLRQLQRYAGRLRRTRGKKGIVSLSAADRRYASHRLPKSVDGVPVMHREWTHVQKLVRLALGKTKKREERLWLAHLAAHLEDYVSIHNKRDNMVYVVSLGKEAIHKSGYTWIDVVEKSRQYFDPVGGTGRLKVPPNYLGFRYRGELQSVHHVDACQVVANLAEIDARWPVTDFDHFVFSLGPALKPSRPMRSGKDMHSRRVSCAIDTLLSGEFDTVLDAEKFTRQRLAAGAAS